MKPISELSPLEIREAVATRVMGLSPVSKLYDPVRDMFVDVTAKRCANDRDVLAVKGPLDMWRELPAYESEIDPAFEVVAKMREKGYHFEMEYSPGENSVCYATFSMYGSRGHARLLPVPLAIAAAALEAIGSAK